VIVLGWVLNFVFLKENKQQQWIKEKQRFEEVRELYRIVKNFPHRNL
jgi:hypothetical protein